MRYAANLARVNSGGDGFPAVPRGRCGRGEKAKGGQRAALFYTIRLARPVTCRTG